MEEAKKKRTIAKGQFTRAEGRLLSAISDQADLWTLSKRYEDMTERWNAAQNAHDEYVSGIDDDRAMETEEAWISELAKRFDKVELGVGERMGKSTTQEQKHDVKLDFHQANSETLVKLPSTAIKMEKLKFQSFNGDIRRFPVFKEEFMKYIQPQCDKSQLAFVLKSYLKDEVCDEIRSIGDDYDKMWDRLDQKYGNIGKLVDTILYDVKRLASSGNVHSMLQMISVVEKAWRDLKSLGQETELYNSTTISIIEQSMTTEMKNEWVKLIASKRFDSKQKFLTLLELLQDWRNRLEYLEASIREEPERTGSTHKVAEQKQNDNKSQRKRRCWLHESEGEAEEHPIWRCRLFLEKSSTERCDLISTNKACWRCLLKECPGVVDKSKCSRNFTCAIPGCGGNHNKLLHTDNGTVHHTQLGEEYSNNPILPIQTL